ncbi:MAG: nucleotidyl transferase AbiEii/AbiGii toxin family protein [Bacilli bacterium]|nr:nucleotidyl transferase AbiEii/AbiGii toxin family protein [Bacilli bacterium]
MFENGNKLKGYIQKEVRNNPMHSNYAYNYYFCRSFLERLYGNTEIFALKGSFSQFSTLKQFTRPLTDIDIVTFENIGDASDMIDQTISKKDDIKFEIKQRFVTTNATINYHILCRFDNIEHLIKIDMKKEENLDIDKRELPKLFAKDTAFNINSISLEEHFSNKLYICFLNLQLHNRLGKQFRRFKDFYDIYSILKLGNVDIDKVTDFLNEKVINDEFLNQYQFGGNLFDQKFIEHNRKGWEADSRRYEFNKDVTFEETVNHTNEALRGRRYK